MSASPRLPQPARRPRARSVARAGRPLGAPSYPAPVLRRPTSRERRRSRPGAAPFREPASSRAAGRRATTRRPEEAVFPYSWSVVYGTGSNPPRLKGWQRRRRRPASAAPRTRPWRAMASLRVHRARGLEPTGPRQQRRDHALVEVESCDGCARGQFLKRHRRADVRKNALPAVERKSSDSSAKLAAAADVRTLTTRSPP